ncbi:hypothetical protein BQ8794_30311 [Mesorhizobium prunaredense]|uniref:Uncharacterized protein n=1 Tax=Mesorhizobium prunaredense TaxID=1631249 RepID=A0A1R3VDI0_9HYPH|nr:hypothetical protein BQ8794_30311 [Mesorhizobium prunaredense]
MSGACFLERVFATGDGKHFRIDLAAFHKPARSGPTDIRSTRRTLPEPVGCSVR